MNAFSMAKFVKNHVYYNSRGKKRKAGKGESGEKNNTHQKTGKRKAIADVTNDRIAKQQKTGNNDTGSDTDDAHVDHDHQYCLNNDEPDADIDDADSALDVNQTDAAIISDITIDEVKLENNVEDVYESDDTISLSENDDAFVDNAADFLEVGAEVDHNSRLSFDGSGHMTKTDKVKRGASFDENGVWCGNRDLDQNDPYFSDIDQFEITYEREDGQDYMQKQQLKNTSAKTKKKKKNVKDKNREAMLNNTPSNQTVHSSTGKVTNFDCIYCQKTPIKPNRSELYRHYSQTHHRHDILEYIKQYYPKNVISKECPVCQRVMGNGGTNKLIDHLGQVHDVVEYFLPEWARISKAEAVMLSNNMKKMSSYF